MMRWKRTAWALLLLTLALITSAGPFIEAAVRSQVVVWGFNPDDAVWREVAEGCRKAFPDMEIIIKPAPPGTTSTTIEQMSQLIAAIAGGAAPDVTVFDRFVLSSCVLRGMFQPLDPFIAKDKFDMSQFYPAALSEMQYQGKFYALPRSIDVRFFYYNCDLFEKNGLDPQSPPRTWSELKSLAGKLTKTDSAGNYTLIGFVPMAGDPWFYTYGWLNGGEFMSPDEKKCTANDPRIVSALQWVVDFYGIYGGAQRVDRLLAEGEKPPWGGEKDFVQDKLAMIAARNDLINTIANLAPNMNFGVAPIPIPEERLKGTGVFAGKPKYIAGSGGWAWAIPNGAKNPEGGWKVMKWLATEGRLAFERGRLKDAQAKGQPYVPQIPFYRPQVPELIKTFLPFVKGRQYQEAVKFAFEMMNYSRARDVTPVASELWREVQEIAWKDAVYLRKTPQAALDHATSVVQVALDKALKEAGKHTY